MNFCQLANLYEIVYIATKMTALDNSKIKLLLSLTLSFCLYTLFNNIFIISISVETRCEVFVNKDLQRVYDQLGIFKIKEPSQKTFNTKDVLLLTGFGVNHFVEALLVLILCSLYESILLGDRV